MFTELSNRDFIKELSILLVQDFVRENWLAKIGRTYTGIMDGDNAGIASKGSFKDAVEASCDPEWTDPDTFATQKWSLGKFMIPKKFCYDNILPEIRRHQSLYNLSEDEAARTWMTSYLENAFAEAVIAKGFFASKNSGDYTTAGFGGIDGILTQMKNYVAGGEADTDQVTAISTNTKAWLKTGTNAIDVIENVIDDAPASVKGSDDAILIVNQTFFDCLSYCLRIAKGINIESQYSDTFKGLKTATYGGYELVIIPQLDAVMAQMVSGDAWYGKAGVVIFTNKSNLLFGTSSTEEAGVADVAISEDFKSQSTLALVKFSLGAVVADPKGFQIAY